MDDFQRGILEALIKSADKLSTTFSDNQKRYEDMSRENQKHHDELSRENREHYEDLMLANQKHSDELLEKEQQYSAELHTQQRSDHKKLTILSIVVGVITFFAAMLWHIESSRADIRLQLKRKEMDVQMQHEASKMDFVKLELQQRYHKESILQDQIRNLQEKINTYFSLRDELMISMANMREVIDYGQEQCVAGKYAGKDLMEYKEKSLRTIYAMVGVIYKITNIFNSNIVNETSNFILAADNKNVCAKNATTSDQLRPMQENINKMIAISIDNLKQEKSDRENELQNEEKAINKILDNNTGK